MVIFPSSYKGVKRRTIYEPKTNENLFLSSYSQIFWELPEVAIIFKGEIFTRTLSFLHLSAGIPRIYHILVGGKA